MATTPTTVDKNRARADRALRDRRDGLLREAEHLNTRLKLIYEQITELNTRIMPTLPMEPQHSPDCGCYYCD